MSGRVLGSYVAIVPDDQDTNVKKRGSLFVAGSKLFDRYLSGKIISVGSKCPDGVEVGQRVLYERMSAHPHQTGPIDADVFGGDPDKFCVLIPVYRGSLRSVSELDEELDRRRRDVQLIEKKHENGSMDQEDRDAMVRHNFRMDQIKSERSKMGRGSNLGKIYDRARGAGVVAIIGD